MKVEILSRKVIAPSSSTPSHLANLKISFLDQNFHPIYAPTIFYHQAASGVNHVEISRRLQVSLSQTLTLFYPLAGRLNEDNISIDCNDKGVGFLEARVSGFPSQLLQGGELLSSLVPSPFQPHGSPLMIFQFNMFEDGGVAISVCAHHRVNDAFTTFKFMDVWATTCRLGIVEVKYYSPSFPLSSLCPPRDAIITATENVIIACNTAVTRRFVFNETTITKLKQAAANNADADAGKLLNHQPTRTEVVAAVIWRALIRIGQATHGRLRPSLFVFIVDMRERTSLPIPKYPCGNFNTTATARFIPDEESKEVRLHDLVSLLHDAKTSVLKHRAKASSGDDLYFMQEKAMKEVNAAALNGEMDVFLSSSWSKFPLYGTDFGFGKPDWVSPADAQSENGIALLDTKDGKGIEVWMFLDKKNVLLFQQNLGEIIRMSKL